MFCPHCGKQLPDGARFCTACGAALTGPQSAPAPARPDTPAQPQYAPPQYTPPQPKKKSKAALIIVTAAVIIAATILGVIAIVPAIQGSSGIPKLSLDSALTEPGESSETSSGEGGGHAIRETNDEYYQTLAVLGYQTPTSYGEMIQGLEDPTVEFFVRDNGDGTIECYDYAAEGDTLVKYCETHLLDLTVVPPEQKEQVVAGLTERLPELDALDFVTADYYERSNGSLGVLYVKCTDLDKEENRRTLCDMGIFSEDGTWSISEIKEMITAIGYISLYK